MKNAIFFVNAVGLFITSSSAVPITNVYSREDPSIVPKAGVTPLDASSKLPIDVVSTEENSPIGPLLNNSPGQGDTQLHDLSIHLHRGDVAYDNSANLNGRDLKRRGRLERNAPWPRDVQTPKPLAAAPPTSPPTTPISPPATDASKADEEAKDKTAKDSKVSPTQSSKDLKGNTIPAPAPLKDGNGNPTSSEDANGNVMKDAAGNPVPVSPPQKDANGNVIPALAATNPTTPSPAGMQTPQAADTKTIQAAKNIQKQKNKLAKQFAASKENKEVVKEQAGPKYLHMKDASGNPLASPVPVTLTAGEKAAEDQKMKEISEAAKKNGLTLTQEIENEDQAIAAKAKANKKTFQQEAADEYKAAHPGSNPPGSTTPQTTTPENTAAENTTPQTE